MMSKRKRESATVYFAAAVLLTCYLTQTIDCYRLKKTERQERRKEAEAVKTIGFREGKIVFGRAFKKGSGLPSQDGTKKSSSSVEDEATYQADSAGKPHDASSSGAVTLNSMKSSLQCGGDQLRFRAVGAGASQFAVEQANAPPMPLSQVPSTCGYIMQRNSLALLMLVPYDGCNMVQEGGNYVLPMRWQGIPVSLWCPKPAAPGRTTAAPQTTTAAPQTTTAAPQTTTTKKPEMPQFPQYMPHYPQYMLQYPQYFPQAPQYPPQVPQYPAFPPFPVTTAAPTTTPAPKFPFPVLPQYYPPIPWPFPWPFPGLVTPATEPTTTPATMTKKTPMLQQHQFPYPLILPHPAADPFFPQSVPQLPQYPTFPPKMTTRPAMTETTQTTTTETPTTAETDPPVALTTPPYIPPHGRLFPMPFANPYPQLFPYPYFSKV